jgi:hypothetical protein
VYSARSLPSDPVHEKSSHLHVELKHQTLALCARLDGVSSVGRESAVAKSERCAMATGRSPLCKRQGKPGTGADVAQREKPKRGCQQREGEQ